MNLLILELLLLSKCTGDVCFLLLKSIVSVCCSKILIGFERSIINLRNTLKF